MTPPLTDLDILNERELTALEQSSGDDCDMAAVRCVVRELRHHRSRALSAEDVEALRHVADELREQIEHWQMLAKTNGWGFSPGQKSRALAALHRLCGSKP